MLCRDLKLSIPQTVPAIEVQASFEKVYWRLEQTVPEEKKELAVPQPCAQSPALNYVEWRGPRPPKALQQAINQLKRRDDIVNTKPDTASGVMVMDSSEYIYIF